MNVSSFGCAIFCMYFILFDKTVIGNVNDSDQHRIQYSPAILKSLRNVSTKVTTTYTDQIPPEIRKRKRGRKGGVRARYRRRAENPPLPAVITGNARSLNNKLEELCANAKFLNEYREAALICISETWFHKKVTDKNAAVENFSLYRCDRTFESEKDSGGGVCVYVNKSWCNNNNIHVTHESCTPDLEILPLSLRPYYIPREFPKIFLNTVYIPPHADTNVASHEILERVHQQQTKSPDSVIFITGDFNQCTLDTVLPTFSQDVKGPTRKDNTLDLFYSNVKNSYKSVRLPPL